MTDINEAMKEAQERSRRFNEAANFAGASASVARLNKEIARLKRQRDELLAMLERACPEDPMNQDELGGCVWCGQGPPGEQYGYAGADPNHHNPNCAWVKARALIERVRREG